MIKNILTYCLLLLITGLAFGQEDSWTLKKDKKDLKIYTRNIGESGIKELKIVTEMQTSLSSIIALFDDVNAYTSWVYSTDEAKITQTIAPNHIYYYSISDFPWPLNNRDVILSSLVEQDPETKVVTSTSTSKHDSYPRQKGMVRVEKLDAQWILTPKSGGIVHIIYTIKTDPGGNIPIFLTNAFIDRGPIQTISKMRDMLKKDKYKNAKVDFIEELAEQSYNH